MKDREFGCICELDANGDPLIANYDACPLHSGKRKEVISEILVNNGSISHEESLQLASKILTEINKV